MAKKRVTSIRGKEMKIEYSTILDAYFVNKGMESFVLYAPQLKAHAKKYGIPMKKWRHLYDYLMSPNFYVPKEVMILPDELR